jgi:hypothetical protein
MDTFELAQVHRRNTAVARREEKVNSLLLTGVFTGTFVLMAPALELCFRGPVSPWRMVAGAVLWGAGLLFTGGCAAAVFGRLVFPRAPDGATGAHFDPAR